MRLSSDHEEQVAKDQEEERLALFNQTYNDVFEELARESPDESITFEKLLFTRVKPAMRKHLSYEDFDNHCFERYFAFLVKQLEQNFASASER